MAATYRQSDVSALLRLAGEVGELPFDQQARRSHILGRLLDLVGGCHAVCSEIELDRPETFGMAVPGSMTHAGELTSTELASVRQYLYSGQPLDPCIPILLQSDGDVVTIRREDVIDRSWFRSEHYNRMRRPAGRGESLYARLKLPNGRHIRMGIQRETRDRPFTMREVRLLNAFHDNLGNLYVLPRQHSGPHRISQIEDLPPRLQPVLRHLLQGDAEKQIARKLELSPHTVHEYVKTLHRLLAVSSRGELLARFIAF